MLLASSKYGGADKLVPVILAALVIYATHPFVAAGLLIHKRTLLMAELLVGSAILNIGLNCLLLPRMGLMGGAITTLLSYLACILSLGYASHRLLPLHIDSVCLLKYGAAALVAWAVGSRLHFSAPIWEFLVRSSVVIACYGVTLYAVDRRVRGGVSRAYDWARTRFGMREEQIPAC